MSYIEIENVSKYYMINHNILLRQSFREMLLCGFGLNVRRKSEEIEKFYALNNISFSVNKGDVLGIIGRNGSGKSTLLKILSRVTQPSSGIIKIGGRVSSLLEVGTGFHGELTGRENIYMNGVVLGMSRHEISLKFDQIVSFSEIAKFLDTPVKRYSSGMLLRLAFAVAAHLDPEILIIDEVLAVGDFEFQKKCLGVIGALGASGRTVLFVSHNIGTVRRLCNRTIFLSNGSIEAEGETGVVIEKYLLFGRKFKNCVEWDLKDAPQMEKVALRSVKITDSFGNSKEAFSLRESLHITTEYEVKLPGHKISLMVRFYNADGVLLFMSSDTATSHLRGLERERGVYKSTCVIPANFLNHGEISISLSLILNGVTLCLYEENVVSCRIFDDMSFSGERGDFVFEWPATAVRPVFDWRIDFYGK